MPVNIVYQDENSSLKMLETGSFSQNKNKNKNKQNKTKQKKKNQTKKPECFTCRSLHHLEMYEV